MNFNTVLTENNLQMGILQLKTGAYKHQILNKPRYFYGNPRYRDFRG